MSSSNWMPVIGARFSRFIEEQPIEAQESIKQSSLKILGRCRKPNTIEAQHSHLVVGEVQSGKTMSFTGVTALARDNGFSLVIVIGGTKDNLLEQTIDRIIKDLHVSGDGGANPWLLEKAKNLKIRSSEISEALNQWNNPNLPDDFKQTVIVATLKTKSSLEKVAKELAQLEVSDLETRPVLIIDDEADQAGLNIAEDPDEESSVYAAISRLRQVVKNNDYLMYTATPQATLLLRIADHLSPDTVTVLNSGRNYVGGQDLFGDENNFVVPIPPEDVVQAVEPDESLGPPRSLKLAIAYFLVGLAIGQKRGFPKPCSMLVHPGTKKELHKSHRVWILDILKSWRSELGDRHDRAFTDCYEADFKEALDWANITFDLRNIWPSDDNEERNLEILHYISHWIPQIEVRVVNSTKAADVFVSEWKKHPGWIVIGGAKLERGFTIENLTVTYMPRGTGVGNADSIQQRGRFFGYKRQYLEMLKGWLATDTISAFSHYIEHENSIREQLSELDKSNLPIGSWRRKFFLDPTLKPTRNQVIKLGINHHKLLKGFIFKQVQLLHADVQKNQELIFAELVTLMKSGERHPLDTRTNAPAHLTVNLKLEKMVELLLDFPMAPEERESLDARIFAIQNLVDDDPELECEVIFMKSLETRKRSIDKSIGLNLEPRIENLMAGRTGTYVGDEKLVSERLITVQFHRVIPTQNDLEIGPASLAAAIHWPSAYRNGLIWETSHQR